MSLFRPSTAASGRRRPKTRRQFKAQDKIYFDQGLRLSVLEIENGKYTAVWRPGSGAQWWQSQLGFSDFKTEDTAYFRQGFRLGFVELQDNPVGI